jgi:Ni/Fe-hydrogenase subunit HybB-like protein
MSEAAAPVRAPILTGPFKVLLGIGIIALLITAWRFAVGLGPATGLSDGYPWGLWIAFDVVTGTALACGGYAVALLVYILNKGKYHPLVRPALLTSALGYSVAGLAIIIDVGRPWFIWRIPLGGFPDWGSYNWNSALLEVALCVMAYTIVLWIELSPAFMEKWKDSSVGWLASFSKKMLPIMEKALIWIIAMGILLPTMHQSSLGTVMLLSGPRLHGLWHTAWVPFLFLISCISMGYAVVVMESAFSARAFRRKPETSMLASMSGVMSLTLFIFLGVRIIDLIIRGRIGMMFNQGMHSVMFWLETVLFLLPAVMLLNKDKRRNLGYLLRAAMLIVLAGSLYRFDTYLVAFSPGENWSYFPTIPEMLVTFGIVALEIMVYLMVVKTFPILSGTSPATGKEIRGSA